MADVLFEYIAAGNSVKVTAIDTVTGTEATVVVPQGMTEQQMQYQALQKLKYILNRKE